MKKSVLAVFLVIAIGAAVAASQFLTQPAPPVPTATTATATTEAFGGNFTLTNQHGQSINSTDFQQFYKLIYFGFATCPDICPTDLSKITDVLNQLPAEMADKIQPIFITVDPERDTPEVLKGFISSFHPRFIALTNGTDDVYEVARRYRVYHEKVQPESSTTYVINHSAMIYLMAPDGEFLHLYRHSDAASAIAADLQQRL